MLNFPLRQTAACLLILGLVCVGVTVAPTALPPAHAQGYSVAGTILGLAIIAGTIYLVTRDQSGVYHRYPYGRYYASHPHYRYSGPYSIQHREYQNRFYRGPLPNTWHGDRGCVGPAAAQCH